MQDVKDVLVGAAALAESPLFWLPLVVAAMVWVFMVGVRIGEMRSDDWWERMLAGHPHGDRIRALKPTRKVAR